MSFNLLKGKKGIIFGALNEQSIAWKVAERAVEEGAEIVLTNTPVSLRMGTLNELAAKCNRSLTSFKKEFRKHFFEPPHKSRPTPRRWPIWNTSWTRR